MLKAAPRNNFWNLITLRGECQGIEPDIGVNSSPKLQLHSYNTGSCYVPRPVARLARLGADGIPAEIQVTVGRRSTRESQFMLRNPKAVRIVGCHAGIKSRAVGCIP